METEAQGDQEIPAVTQPVSGGTNFQTELIGFQSVFSVNHEATGQVFLQSKPSNEQLLACKLQSAMEHHLVLVQPFLVRKGRLGRGQKIFWTLISYRQ